VVRGIMFKNGGPLGWSKRHDLFWSLSKRILMGEYREFKTLRPARGHCFFEGRFDQIVSTCPSLV
jgi:hypothetical protein